MTYSKLKVSMKHLLPAITSFFKSHAPLLLVVFTALTVALTNIDPNKYYTGWDNIHAEFDLARYAKQVFFGAWLEHQGPGAPAALAHASEIPRLPIIFLLKLLLPDNLVRYAFTFLMYLVGGIGTYYFLSKYWLRGKLNGLRKWIASLGGILYLLHVLTLQQFYISFELFTVQFAFLPFLLIAVHKLAKSITVRSVLMFSILQLLIAPSGHTPTVFYLGTMLMVLYAYFLKLERASLIEAIKFSLVVGLMAFFTNAYWIIPNLHYSFNNAHYVSESRENYLFAPESLFSIRESSTYENFLHGTHYLFTWKDYSIENQEYQYIFDDWLPHLNSESVQFILGTIGRITILGFFLLLFAKNKGKKRFGIIYMYLIAVIFIWIDMFATKNIFELLFRSNSFMEAFRNPFTKLSVIYAFVSVLLFAYAFEAVSVWLEKFEWKKITGRKLSLLLIGIALAGVVYSALPAFKGHFISEVLQTKYPVAYEEFYDYLNTRDKDLRILQLPQTTQAGWEIYDWSFIEPGNGYQGMGFKFFSIPQPIMNRDSDRWVETSDFFYHELKYALDSQNTKQFTELLSKYQIDLILIDETTLDPHGFHEFEADHQLALDAGLEKVWQNGFLTIYERFAPNTENELLIPEQITLANGKTERVREDHIYRQNGDYIFSQSAAADYYPFAGVMSPVPTEAVFSINGVVFSQSFPGNYTMLEIPGIEEDYYLTPVEITYYNNTVHLDFPQYEVSIGDKHIALPSLPDRTVALDQPNGKIMLFINNIGIEVEKMFRSSPYSS